MYPRSHIQGINPRFILAVRVYDESPFLPSSHYSTFEADQEIVRVEISLLSNFWILTGVLRDVELGTVIVT